MAKRLSFSPKGRPFALDDDMIALRDGLARGLGFVLRRCSLGGDFDCWERPELTCEHRGRPISSYHGVRVSNRTINGESYYHWPEKAEIAAWAIDKGKPAKVEREKATPLLEGSP